MVGATYAHTHAHTHAYTHVHTHASPLSPTLLTTRTHVHTQHTGWCAHQVALGFLFTNFLNLFAAETRCDEFRRVYPPSVFMVQREGCPWEYVVSKDAKASTRCFDKLKFDTNKAPPKSMRDTEQRLVARVIAWRNKWLKETNTHNKRHAFALNEVRTPFPSLLPHPSTLIHHPTSHAHPHFHTRLKSVKGGSR